MNKEFIPYKQALALKELGFDEPCFGWFRSTLIPSNFTEYFLETEFGMNEGPSDWVNSNFSDKACSAPLYQQAFNFLSNKFDINRSNFSIEFNKGAWDVIEFYNDEIQNIYRNEEGLQKLIDIVKSKS